MKPAGLDNAVGVISGQYLSDPSDADLQGTKELADYLAFMKQYLPDSDPNDTFNLKTAVDRSPSQGTLAAR